MHAAVGVFLVVAGTHVCLLMSAGSSAADRWGGSTCQDATDLDSSVLALYVTRLQLSAVLVRNSCELNLTRGSVVSEESEVSVVTGAGMNGVLHCGSRAEPVVVSFPG